jgi:hypothetical protein
MSSHLPKNVHRLLDSPKLPSEVEERLQDMLIKGISGAPLDAGSFTMTNHSVNVPEALNLDALFAEMRRVLASIPPEPIGEWMRSKGFPPEQYIVVLPKAMREHLIFPPRYVLFSYLPDVHFISRSSLKKGFP